LPDLKVSVLDFGLILSVLVLIAAPLLARLVKRAPGLKSGLDGFVLITVVGLITLTLLPEALNHGGAIGLLVAVVGFTLPWLAEFLFHRSEEMTHRVLMLIAALALVVHAASDGAILAFASGTDEGPFLAAGIVLHRIGVAVAVWWLLRPILTTWGGIAVLAALGVMTVVGYLMVYLAGEWYNMPLVGYWQAFAAGSLFHIVMHPLDDHNTAPAKGTANAHRIGTAFGVVFLAALISAHYLQHGPGPIESLVSHGNHHDVDLMAAIGRLIAPIALLAMAAAALYARLKDNSLATAYDALRKVTPWTLAGWLAASITQELFPDLLPTPAGGTIMLVLWLAVTAAVLIHTGARSFFAVLMPRFTRHNHSHSHG
jgi:hypothetical protein